MISKPLVSAAACSLLTAVSTHALPNPDCPLNSYTCESPGSYTPETFTTESQLFHECRSSSSPLYASMLYDLRNGVLSADCWGGDLGSFGEMRLSDDFTVIGLPHGTPVTLTAKLRVQGQISVAGNISSSLVINNIEADLTAYTTEQNPYVTLDSTLQVSVLATTGVPQRISYTLFCYAGREQTLGTCNASASLSFSDLPQGTLVTSCQGYTQDFPIVAKLSTWSWLKARFP
jgi:hypothetical protein